jgi:hypothetical protein
MLPNASIISSLEKVAAAGRQHRFIHDEKQQIFRFYLSSHLQIQR